MKIFLEKGISHLDLHGTKHNDVDAEILDFTYQYQDQLPLIIICGNVLAPGNFLKKSSRV